ncbi:hypothetical protein [Oceaniglobus trochenteri]|uniref:hypothetical protein n=1 Tax=Oceaniglobus trochenteri TaxID=2763260 RepID=UPI001CFF6975|nr:hypothetical protein [Oceaniglobus trochenteri]
MTGFNALRIATLSALALAVAGCAGGLPATEGAGSGPEIEVGKNTRPIDMQRRIELNNDFQGLRNRYGSLNPATAEDLPGTGTATYNGVAALGADPDAPEILSSMAMTVYFGSGDVTGSMWDFHDATGRQAGGSVQLTGTQRPNLPGGPSGEAGKFRVARVGMTGHGTLDWGDHEQELDVAIDGYIHDDNQGLKGQLDIESTIDDDVSRMWGMVMVENDRVKNPVLD